MTCPSHRVTSRRVIVVGVVAVVVLVVVAARAGVGLFQAATLSLKTETLAAASSIDRS